VSFIRIDTQLGQNTTLLIPFIILIAFVWIALVYYSYRRYGWKKTIMYFLPMIITSLFIESAGVASGRYVYSGYLVYLSVVGGEVPLSIILAWSANLFLFMNISRHLITRYYPKRNRLQIIFIALLAGIVGVCVDLLEDPIAHHNNWWLWKGSLAGLKYYDVPILNFIGWFLLLFFMTLATLLIERSRFTENRKVLIAITSISITGTIVFIVHGGIVRLFELFGLA
jgi:uncharacterized membrane protein